MKESISIMRLVGDAYVFTMMPVVNRSRKVLSAGKSGAMKRRFGMSPLKCWRKMMQTEFGKIK